MNGILFYSTLFVVYIKGLFRPAHLLSSPLFTITHASLFYIIYLIHLLISFAFLYAASSPVLSFLHFGHVLCTVCTVRR